MFDLAQLSVISVDYPNENKNLIIIINTLFFHNVNIDNAFKNGHHQTCKQGRFRPASTSAQMEEMLLAVCSRQCMRFRNALGVRVCSYSSFSLVADARWWVYIRW